MRPKTISDRLADFARDLKLYGPLTASRVNLTPLSRRFIVERLLRRVAAPSLMDLLASESEVHISPDTLIESLTGPISSRLRELHDEFDLLWQELQTRYQLRSKQLGYSNTWALEQNSCLLLYSLVRLLRPTNILETGVANGQSPFVCLQALARNGRGRLISVDVHDDVGGLLTHEERTGWDLRIINRRRIRSVFRELVSELPQLDLYLHDSEHTYSWQTFEYSLVTSKLGADGIFMSDDVDGTYAYLDYCRRIGRRPLVLLDHRKVVGLARPNQPDRPGQVAIPRQRER